MSNDSCEVCGRPTGGCCTVPDNEPKKKKFKVVRLPAPEIETFRIDADAIYRIWAREAFEDKEDA